MGREDEGNRAAKAYAKLELILFAGIYQRNIASNR
jgi:hypothetical protein